jgi:AraC family transcriptional regulator, positive regulator of tynA and feaB
MQSDDSPSSWQKRLQGWRASAGSKAGVSSVFRLMAGVPVLNQSFPVCRGQRRGVGASHASPPYVAVVYIAEGRARGHAVAKPALLQPGTVAVWHSSDQVTINVVEPLKTCTFLFSENDLTVCLRKRREQQPITIASDSPLGPMLSGFFGALTRGLDTLPERYHEATLAMARELVEKAVSAEVTAAKSPGDLALERIFEYISHNLHDPNLSPETLAKEHGISVRYLHLLFSRRQLQVATWIRQRRLERCRGDLTSAPDAVTITSIALKWGFNDSSHFSRLFSNTYGEAPNAYRRRSRRTPEHDLSTDGE